MRKPRAVDWWAVFPMVVLVLIGLIMIMSSSAAFAKQFYGDSFYFLKRHAVYICIGTIAFIIGMRVPHGFYRKYFFQGFALTLVLLVLVFVPGIGLRIAGASRWLDLGFINIQPVEIAKFYCVVFVAMALENKADKMHAFFKGIVPILAVIGVPVILVLLEPDLGSTLVILFTTFTLLFLSKVPIKQLVALGIVGLMLIVVNIMLHPYQMDRVEGFLSPWSDPTGKNYHTIQSFIAIGSGGIWGLGLGESKLKYFYLPLQYADFIFSIVCEEGGFLFAFSVVFLFLMLFVKGMAVALRATSLYGYNLAVGLTCILVYQAIINLGVVTGLLPVTGIPLTFISFGGTSLVTSMFFVGVIANISKRLPVDTEPTQEQRVVDLDEPTVR